MPFPGAFSFRQPDPRRHPTEADSLRSRGQPERTTAQSEAPRTRGLPRVSRPVDEDPWRDGSGSYFEGLCRIIDTFGGVTSNIELHVLGLISSCLSVFGIHNFRGLLRFSCSVEETLETIFSMFYSRIRGK